MMDCELQWLPDISHKHEVLRLSEAEEKERHTKTALRGFGWS